MNGKGSKSRITNRPLFRSNFDQIDWGRGHLTIGVDLGSGTDGQHCKIAMNVDERKMLNTLSGLNDNTINSWAIPSEYL
jgi:hypothetical protein